MDFFFFLLFSGQNNFAPDSQIRFMERTLITGNEKLYREEEIFFHQHTPNEKKNVRRKQNEKINFVQHIP